MLNPVPYRRAPENFALGTDLVACSGAMNEPLMHGVILLGARCAQLTSLPTRAEVGVLAEEIATELGLNTDERKQLVHASKAWGRETIVEQFRYQLLADPGGDGWLRSDGCLSFVGAATLIARLKRLGPPKPYEWGPGEVDDEGALTPLGEQNMRKRLDAMDSLDTLSNLYVGICDHEDLRDLRDEASDLGIDIAQEATRVRAVLVEAVRTAPNTQWPKLRKEVLKASEVITDESLANEMAD
jgi:hypothetical protein